MSNTRTLQTLTEESTAILSHGMDYAEGQLPFISENFKQINKSNMPIECDRYFVHMSERSVCPWKFQKNIDNNRIPREITEAVCRAKNTAACGTATVGLQTVRNGCLKHECREVKYFTKVLRRNSTVESEKQFIPVLEPISAGCTCMCSELKRMTNLQRLRMCD